MDIFSKYKKEIELAYLIRKTEESLLSLFSMGKLFGTVHTCIGQEFSAVAVGRNLSDNDNVFSNHRCHGHFLAYKRNVKGLISEIMGKKDGVCGGLGGSQHLYQDNFYSNGIQGGILPVSAGLAMVQKLEKNNGITIVFIGDGTLGEGVVYETMNIASKWELPLLIVCENNSYAQSTSIDQTLAGDITDRAKSFGIKSCTSNTWKWDDLFLDMEQSFDFIRNSSKPVFHLVNTYRLKAHSKGDDDRSKQEITDYESKDSLNIILNSNKDNPVFKDMLKHIDEEIQNAILMSMDSPFSILENMAEEDTPTNWQDLAFDKERCVTSIQRAFNDILSENKKTVFIGEDIESPYGGAFKCTMELSNKFPGRVLNTPISEAAILGIGNGLALGGYYPFVEFMFGDFLALAADQWINHAAKFNHMYNNEVKVPVVVRAPMGGHRGYGPTHSQSLEKHFVGVPGTQVFCLNHRFLPYVFYKNLADTIDRPSLVIENKVLYSKYITSELLPGYELLESDDLFPTINLKPRFQADYTVIAIGGVSLEVEDAIRNLFEKDEIIIDLFMPTRIYPFDISVLSESIKNTKKLIIIEEGQGFCSIGSEIIAQVIKKYYKINIFCERIFADEIAIPASKPLEDQSIPTSNSIIEKIRELNEF